MRYAFFELDEYSYKPKVRTRNIPLEDLFEYITDNQAGFIHLRKEDDDSEKVIIWSNDFLKPSLPFRSFATDEQEWAYGEEYGKYGIKRLAEMPAIRIFQNNLDFLMQQWQEIRNIRRPKYLILREHMKGYIDYVDIVEKQELSDQDIMIMNREHKIYQNYVKRRKEYENAHPEKLYPVWRSSVDNEFESDFALYDPIDEQGVD